MLVNAKIEKAGLYYNGHYRSCAIMLELELREGGASLEIPVDLTEEFMEMFKDELDLENGAFVNDLEGVPVVLKTDGDRFGKIVAIGSILANEDELLDLNGSD